MTKKLLTMKILHLSDTHGCHRLLPDLPEADVIVHSGDFTMNDSEQEAIDFMNWLCDLPHKHKIFICGNHDECLHGAHVEGLDPYVHLLCNSGVEIDSVKFYGVPMFPDDCVTGQQRRNIACIPAGTDILVTHEPAYGILDFDNGVNYGNEELLVRINEIRPHLHLFGHIHERHGMTTMNGTTYSNGAIMNSNYTNINNPNLIDYEH